MDPLATSTPLPPTIGKGVRRPGKGKGKGKTKANEQHEQPITIQGLAPNSDDDLEDPFEKVKTVFFDELRRRGVADSILRNET